MVIQGNLLGLDFNHIYIYTNTLQAIAAGYLIASLEFLLKIQLSPLPAASDSAENMRLFIPSTVWAASP